MGYGALNRPDSGCGPSAASPDGRHDADPPSVTLSLEPIMHHHAQTGRVPAAARPDVRAGRAHHLTFKNGDYTVRAWAKPVQPLPRRFDARGRRGERPVKGTWQPAQRRDSFHYPRGGPDE
jgi:hypothetical protein